MFLFKYHRCIFEQTKICLFSLRPNSPFISLAPKIVFLFCFHSFFCMIPLTRTHCWANSVGRQSLKTVLRNQLAAHAIRRWIILTSMEIYWNFRVNFPDITNYSNKSETIRNEKPTNHTSGTRKCNSTTFKCKSLSLVPTDQRSHTRLNAVEKMKWMGEKKGVIFDWKYGRCRSFMFAMLIFHSPYVGCCKIQCTEWALVFVCESVCECEFRCIQK